MKTLLIDAGNSRLKWQWLETGHSSPIQERANTDLPADELLQYWKAQAPAAIHVACVAGPSLRSWLEKQLPDIAPTQFYRSPAQTGPLINAYDRPADLGVDRWCAMLAVPVLGRAPFVLVDCGTALTLDAVAASGQHLGGSILISPETALRALHDYTGLPHAQTVPEVQWLHDNSLDALAHGQWSMAIAAIEQFLVTCEQRIGTVPQRFIAGGASATLAPLLPQAWRVLHHPVLRGLQRWIEISSKG